MAVSFAMVDEDGDRVFGNQDIPDLGRKSAVPLMRIYRAILRLSTDTGYPETMPTHQKQTDPPRDFPSADGVENPESPHLWDFGP